jgi:hypothetical protein
VKPTYSGEVQFAGYSDSSRSGPRVTLRLADRADLDRFVGCEGKRYMLVLVEIGEDEQPVQAKKASSPDAWQELGPLCKWAVMRDDDPMFKAWIPHGVNPRDYILEACEIGSRKELDTDPAAASRFHQCVRRPFAAWLQEQGVTA